MTDSQILRRLAREPRPFVPRLSFAVLLGAATGLLMVVGPAALNVIMNRVIVPAATHRGAPDLAALYWALAATYVSLVFANLATYGTNYTTTWCGQRLLANLRQSLYERLLAAPIQVFERWRPGELIARFTNDLQF